MSYYFSKKFQGTFDEIYVRTLASLKREEFGVLTEIDVRATLEKKMDIDFRKYRILGACNPAFAYKALQAEDKIGTMLPCNVIIQELGKGEVEVAAIDPIASMQAIENETLMLIAQQVRKKMFDVVENV
jgi:uncharacterized protein (DUF302 family)